MLVMDSGCSRHMTGDKALLSHFEENTGLVVTFGDDSIGTTMGYGNLEYGNVIIQDIALVGGLFFLVSTNLLTEALMLTSTRIVV